jgi:hypothetical protein
MWKLMAALLCFSASVFGQSPGSAGTIRGRIADPSGAVVAGVTVSLSNDVTLYRRGAKASDSGEFQFTNIPPNVYHLEVEAAGFQRYHRDLTVRSVVPEPGNRSIDRGPTGVGDGGRGGVADGNNNIRAHGRRQYALFEDAHDIGCVRAH